MCALATALHISLLRQISEKASGKTGLFTGQYDRSSDIWDQLEIITLMVLICEFLHQISQRSAHRGRLYSIEMY